MAKKESNKKTLVILSIIFASTIVLLAASFLVYHVAFNHHRPYPEQNYRNAPRFTINNNTALQIESFFNSNPDNQSVQSYCQQNMSYCFYYCSQINQTNSACSNIPHPQFNGLYRNISYNRNFGGPQ